MTDPTACFNLTLSEGRSVLAGLGLEQLDLHTNMLTALPTSGGKLLALNKLDLSENKLVELPISICELSETLQVDGRATLGALKRAIAERLGVGEPDAIRMRRAHRGAHRPPARRFARRPIAPTPALQSPLAAPTPSQPKPPPGRGLPWRGTWLQKWRERPTPGPKRSGCSRWSPR